MHSNTKNKLVLLVAGGTGGHTIPCSVLTNYLKQKRVKTCVVSDSETLFSAPNKLFIHLSALPQKKLSLCFVKDLMKKALFCFKLLREKKPSHIVLFGNIYCLPMLIAHIGTLFCFQSSKLILQEQNIVLGRFHRLAQYFAHKIALGFPHTKNVACILQKKAIHTGTPVRLHTHTDSKQKTNKQKSLLILGGSQGANFFASQRFLNLFYECESMHLCKVFHQVPAPFVSTVQHFYKKIGVTAEVTPFFSNIETLLPHMTAIISRAGGSTLAEALSHGIPMLLVPYRYATDHHQRENASFLTQNNVALMLEEDDATPEALSECIKKLLNSEKTRLSMKKKMRTFSCKYSCQKIYKML